MHVISRKKLNDFVREHPEANNAIYRWYKEIKLRQFQSFADLKIAFSGVDKVEKFTVFDIGGNKYRLIAAIHYNRSKLYIRHVLTHNEYNLGKWKNNYA